MNKSELIDTVATTAGLERKQAEAAIGAFVDSVVVKTKSGEPVSIFGFGTFKPTQRAARTGRNPQTGAAVKIAASKGVKFQPATAFKTVLNTKATKKAAVAAKKKAAAAPVTAKKAVATSKKTVAPAAKKATAPAKKVEAPAKKITAAVKKTPVAKKVTAPAKKTAATKKR